MGVFWTSIQSVLSIVIIIAIGYACQGAGWFGEGFQSALSKLIMNVALPASIFMAMLSRFKPKQLATLSTGLIYVILSVAIGYLIDLRRPEMQKGLILRSKIMSSSMRFMEENGFLDIETPYLAKSTPEGARDYLVPSRIYPGSFYALPQSPQLFKQLLMGAGFDRSILRKLIF